MFLRRVSRDGLCYKELVVPLGARVHENGEKKDLLHQNGESVAKSCVQLSPLKLELDFPEREREFTSRGSLFHEHSHF